MKQIFILATLFFSLSSHAQTSEYPVHILPGSPSADYQNSLQKAWFYNAMTGSSYVQDAIRAGSRNLQWLDYLNAHRPDTLALTKKGELHSYPIDNPSVYSPKTIETEYKDLLAQIPPSMRTIIFEGAAYTDTLTIPADEYVTWAKKVDFLYQTAARWSSLAPSLTWYAQNKYKDIRGYYFLSRETDLQQKLTQWSSLSDNDHNRFSTYLVNLCENSRIATAQCTSALNAAISQNTVWTFYQQYNPRAHSIYDSFFNIGGRRSELLWNSKNPGEARIPFRQTDTTIQNFLAVNIEDEWKWLGWQLRLDFQSNASVHVEFQPGVVPHVNGLGGDTIIMDRNASLNEWDVQWTIRHEFGHVLGFPDCYVEFYDSAAQQMVNYQIDISDLMCSRAGRFKQNHFDQMKSAYYRN